jgi:hypothetical protein
MKKNRQFYTVCNPTVENERTGNVCINISDLTKFDKDFLYKCDGEEIILKKEWVRDNLKSIWVKKEDIYGTERRFPIYILKVQDILNAA